MAKDEARTFVKNTPKVIPSKGHRVLAIVALVIGLVLVGLVVWRWLYPPQNKVGATITLPTCGTETYEFYQDGSNSRVAINVHNSDEELDATGLNGWSITGIDLDEEGGSKNYTKHLSSGNRDNYNPSSFGDIGWVKVELTKACPTPTVTPTPTPTPIVCDQQTFTCGECGEKPNDDVCGEIKYGYCKENYSCGYADDEWQCDCPVVTPTPTPVPVTVVTTESKPEGCASNCGVPACTDQVPEAVVNPHVYRNGDCALVKWWPKQGDKANIYWRENSSSGWQHALANISNTGYREICGLETQSFTFGVQSVNGCAADGIINASVISEIVDGNTSSWVLFR
jgi:hypothetical protein